MPKSQPKRLPKPRPAPREANPLNFLTSVALPLLPLKAGCRLCKLFRTDPEGYSKAHEQLLFGVAAADVARLLAARGHTFAERTIYNHYGKHVKEPLQQILEIRRQQFALQVAAAETDPEEQMQLLGSLLFSQVNAAVQRINLPAIAGNITEAGDAIELLDKATKLLRVAAEVRRSSTDTDLKREMVELSRLELLVKQGRFEAAAERIIRNRIADVPARVQEQVVRLLLPHLGNVAQQLKQLALPVPAEAKPTRKRRG